MTQIDSGPCVTAHAAYELSFSKFEFILGHL